MKQCMPNPWEDFAREYKKGDKVRGAIKSITDFGVFVGLPGGIDGLVHLSFLSWSTAGEEAVKNFKKGEDLEAVVLSIDVERERISLGVKQLEGDPFTNFIASHEKNSLVQGTVKSVDAKGAVIDIGGVEGYLRASEFARDRIDDLAKHLKEGDAVQAMIINVDRKNRSINLSVKAKDLSEETDAMKQLRTEYAVKMILDAMTQSLLSGHRIEIRGFGSFGLNYRPPRTGRNPKSGEKVHVPEKYVPHFKAGKELRERVDGATPDASAAPQERASQPVR